MPTPTATPKLATSPAASPFAGLPCLHCGHTGGVTVALETLAFNCDECGDDLTADEVRTTLAQWARVLRWIDKAGSDE